jgi:SAM-dependent methyltransferase
MTEPTPAEYWESRYAEAESIWSGKVNRTLKDVVEPLAPGRALELGCGEGGDALWLASRGWVVTAVDISVTAVERGGRAAASAGIAADRIRWIAHDLTTWTGEDAPAYDLVTASFLQSPLPLDRAAILRRAASWIVPGGRLVVVSHAAPPPWSALAHAQAGGHGEAHDHEHRHGRDSLFPTPDEEVAALGLPDDRWTVLVSEVRQREATGPSGETAVLDDSLVVLVARS